MMQSRISYSKYKILFIILFVVPFDSFSQCELSESLEIEDFTTTSIPIYVENALNNDLSDPDQGLCGILLEFEHTHIGDLIVELVSPSGQSILIIGTVVNSGNTSATNWNVFFTSCGSPASPDPGFDQQWSNNQSWGILANYSGTYYPNTGCLEDFDFGTVNGTWYLNITDANLFDTGELLDFSLLFCDPVGLNCVDCFEIQNESSIAVDTINCYNPIIQLDLDSPYDFDSLHWAGPNGFTSEEPNPQIDKPGIYTVTGYYQGICTTTFEQEVIEDIYVPELIGEDGYIDCNNPMDSLTLTVIDLERAESISWTGPSSFNSEEYRPLISEAGNYYVTVTNKNGCSSTAELNIESNFQVPQITMEDIELPCNPDSVELFIEVDLPIVSYYWTGPDDFTSKLSNPKLIDTGEYILQVEAFNGCTASDTLILSQKFILPEYSIVQQGSLNCFLDSVILIAEEVDDDAFYKWVGSEGLLSLNDTLIVYSSDSIRFIITGQNECLDSTSIIIVADTLKPEVDIVPEGYLKCEQQSMELISLDSISDDLVKYEWSTMNGLILSEIDTDTIEIGLAGTYFLNVQDQANGCEALDSILVMELINDMHDLTAELTAPSCSEVGDGKIRLTEVLGGKPPFLYALNENPFGTEQLFEGLEEGEYIISVKDQDGCFISSSVNLEAEELFLVDLGPDLEVAAGELLKLEVFTNINEDQIDSIIWEPEALTPCTDCNFIEFIITQDTTIEVTVVDTNNCKNTSFVDIQVKLSDDYYIPNIFSPNGDGFNDYFQVYSSGAINQIKQMIIFDKQGNPYFHEKSFPANQDEFGWNGSWGSKQAGQGVYIYYIEIELLTGEIIWESGDITLLR